jgi:hypothetical protein
MPSLERAVARRLSRWDMRSRVSVQPYAKVQSWRLQIPAPDDATTLPLVLCPSRLSGCKMNRERRALRTIHLHVACELTDEVMY